MDSSRLTKKLKSDDDNGDVGNDLRTRGEVKDAQDCAQLPEEILELIFSFVTDSKDLENIANASPQFSRIIGPTKQAWLFNKVFPLIYPQLEKADILNCRGVCKQWRKGVDNCLQSRPLVRIMEDYEPASTVETRNTTMAPYAPQFQQNLCRKRFMSIQLYDGDIISRFMETARALQDNPFVLRAISLDDGPYAGDEQNLYWANVFCLLDDYGEHIWHLYIHTCYDNGRHHARYCYNMLRRCLSSLPNLRTLAIRGFMYHFYQAANNEVPRKPYRISRLADYVISNPLPDLPSLKALEIGLQSTIDNDIVHRELIRKYSHCIRSLMSPLSLWNGPRELLNQLTRVEMFVDDSIYKWAFFCNLLDAPNLGKLTLVIHHNISVVDMLTPLVSFSKLRYLGWRFYRRVVEPVGTRRQVESQLILPQVKTLEIMDNPYAPYSLLIKHLPNLEFILVCCEDQDWWKPRANLYLTLGEDDQSHYNFKNWIFTQAMMGVSIWELLVNLKEITFGWMGADQFSLYEIVATKKYARESYRKDRHKELVLACTNGA